MISSKKAAILFSAALLLNVFNLKAAIAEDHPWADYNAQQPYYGATQPEIQPYYESREDYAVLAMSSQSPQLARTVTGMPVGRTYVAKANLALQAVHRNTLPPTRLDSFIRTSGMNPAIYGKDGDIKNVDYAPISSGFDGITAAGLTTGHPSDAPNVYDFVPINPPKDELN